MRMIGICRFLSVLTRRFLKRELGELRVKLEQLSHAYLDDRLNRPSNFIQQLLISGEDHRFFQHGGVDLFAVCRAIWRTIFRGHLEGASTIEMQVVRVITGKYERTIARKLHEMLLAVHVYRFVPKENLPGIYLQIGYYGWRMNNFREACQHLDLVPQSMSAIDSASLVARLKYPQPLLVPIQRRRKIEIRAKYLIRLHIKHQRKSFIFGQKVQPVYAGI